MYLYSIPYILYILALLGIYLQNLQERAKNRKSIKREKVFPTFFYSSYFIGRLCQFIHYIIFCFNLFLKLIISKFFFYKGKYSFIQMYRIFVNILWSFFALISRIHRSFLEMIIETFCMFSSLLLLISYLKF